MLDHLKHGAAVIVRATKTGLIVVGMCAVSFLAGATYHTSISMPWHMPVNVQIGQGGAQAAEADYNQRLNVLAAALPESGLDHPRPTRKPQVPARHK